MAAALWAPAALAVPDSQAVLQFAAGRYIDAARAAEAAGGADNFAFAARARLAEAMTDDAGPDPSLVADARRLAEAALALDPADLEARLQLAIALSLTAKGMETMAALRSGMVGEARRLALEAAQADPENAYIHGFLAVWHLEVRRRAGAVGSGVMNASVREARASYARAAQLAPEDAGLHWQFGRALAALDARGNRSEALAALDLAIAASPEDHLGRVMQKRARRLADILREGDYRAAGQLARTLP